MAWVMLALIPVAGAALMLLAAWGALLEESDDPVVFESDDPRLGT